MTVHDHLPLVNVCCRCVIDADPLANLLRTESDQSVAESDEHIMEGGRTIRERKDVARKLVRAASAAEPSCNVHLAIVFSGGHNFKPNFFSKRFFVVAHNEIDHQRIGL